jgi:hypothetical protein
VIQRRREKEAVIKIQRSVSPMKVRRKRELEIQRTEKMSTIVTARLLEVCIDIAVLDCCGDLSTEFGDEERRQQEEENRIKACERMHICELEMLQYLDDCSALSEAAVHACLEDYVDNEVCVSAAFAISERKMENERQAEQDERKLMSFEEQRTVDLLRSQAIADIASRDKLAARCVEVVMASWIECEIDRLYVAHVPMAIQLAAERLEEAKQVQLLNVIRVTARLTVDYIFAACSLPEQVLHFLCQGDSIKLGAVADIPKSASIGTVKEDLDARLEVNEGFPGSVPSSAMVDFDSIRVMTAPKPREKLDSFILHDTAISFVNSLWRRNSNSLSQNEGYVIVNQSQRRNSSVSVSPRVQDDVKLVLQNSDDVPNKNCDDYSQNSHRSNATVAELRLGQLSVEVETCLYGAEYSSTLASIEKMRVCVLENKETGELTESKFEYYLMYSHLLMAECLIEIADYSEAVDLLSIVLGSVVFMNAHISRAIVEDSTPFALNNVATTADYGQHVASSGVSVSSLGSRVFIEIDVEMKARVWVAMANIARHLAQYMNVEPNLEKVSIILMLLP